MIQLALLVPLGAATALLLHRSRVRHAVSVERLLPALASELARQTRAGATLRTALEEAARTAPPVLREDLRTLTGRLDRGIPMAEVLERWRSSARSPGVDLLAGACRFGAAHGGDLALALDGAASALRDAVELSDETRALTAQARTSVRVLVALPFAGAALFALLDPAVARTLVASPLGWACIAAGAALDSAGLALSSWLVRRAAG